MTIPEQLTKIYYDKEYWHKTRMSVDEAIDYHKTRYENGDIQTYVRDGEVLGYYERYIVGNTCILYNYWIREDLRNGIVHKDLKRRFFSSMPKNVKNIIGECQKQGGRIMESRIRRTYGND